MLSEDQVRFIERLRDAAREHGAVADLLSAISDCLYVDDVQGVITIGDKDDIEWLKAALVASQFVDYDRGGSSVKPSGMEDL